MNNWKKKAGPVALTLATVAVAIVVGQHLWDYYTAAPWTRDGRIRANVVTVAPDVAGLISEVKVRDNQLVKRGQVLFVVDQARYRLALTQAQAALRKTEASLSQAQREASRNKSLSDLLAAETVEQGNTRLAEESASLAAARSAVELAELNLQRTVITSPVDGYVNDRLPRAGDYVLTGKPALSLVDAASFHVDGYFEETKLNRIRLGQPAELRIMGGGVLRGHVSSIAAGIEDRDRNEGSSLLPNVNPTFNWVRLAQRIPVRVSLDAVPGDVRLIAGRTVTVVLDEKNGGRQ
ncbi:efflux RND transporter periplasmic adaptor subunit [uncultured Aquitalea sp.]|uniref:efflux RND transporter periplasmic adaptor subunit n=1 Tax=uncultured Aquitalea sp. TaxID=540272 RepID=UPI0025DA9FF5|nr:efflux RND transporter periplasmic adaptor subunit [uncultured Aquitalea sp.]